MFDARREVLLWRAAEGSEEDGNGFAIELESLLVTTMDGSVDGDAASTEELKIPAMEVLL